MTSTDRFDRAFAGRYTIEGKLGAGGMGEVYRARDATLAREVALKVLPAAEFDEPAARARLLREARTAAQLNHPHICTIHEVGEVDGEAYIAMELVEGRPLSDRLSDGALPVEDVVRIGRQLADALNHAHERGVVHRDLKSANVMITADGRAKVLDFGVAKQFAGTSLADAIQSQQTRTATGVLVGTPAYMSPEQLCGAPADPRSDVWALGVVLYEMAAGSLPFRGETGFALSSAILNKSPAPLPARIPLELRTVIERCLEKQSTARYQQAAEVGAALDAMQTGAVLPWEALRYRLMRRRWLAAVAGATVLVLVVAALNFGSLRARLFGAAPRSFAVLPVENLSGDPSQEYLSDGLTEALITDLGRLAGLKRVIPRGSVMRYKGTTKTPSEIGRELNVDALITASVLRAGNRLSLTVHLVNSHTEEETWQQKYERDFSDMITLGNELTRAIAGEIRLTLAPEEQSRTAAARRVNPEAYDAYLQGRFHWQKLSATELDIAERYFQLAVEKDPEFAPAWQGIGIVWALRCNMGVMRCTDAIVKAMEADRKAASLDPVLAAQLAEQERGGGDFYKDWNWAAGADLTRQIQENPNDPILHVWYAEYLLYIEGRMEEGIAEMRRGLELDPFNSTHKAWVGQALVAARKYDEAITYLRQVLQEDPNAPLARAQLVEALEAERRYDEALAERKRMAAGNQSVLDALDRGYREGGYPGAMRRQAERAVERSKQAYVAPTNIAGFYARAGEKELALDWLEKAFEDRDMQMLRINGVPRWDSLRDHPRFRALLRRMNLPP